MKKETGKKWLIFLFAVVVLFNYVSAAVKECEPADIMLVVDNSSSMNNLVIGDYKRIDFAKMALKDFIEEASIDSSSNQYRVGLVSFSSGGTVNGASELISFLRHIPNEKSILLEGVNKVGPYAATDIFAGLVRSSREFLSNPRGVKQIVVFLSDGDPTQIPDDYDSSIYWGGYPHSTYTTGFCEMDERPCMRAINLTKEFTNKMKNDGVILYTVGIGDDLSAEGKNLLDYMASTASKYIHVVDLTELSNVYQKIASDICSFKYWADLADEEIFSALSGETVRIVKTNAGESGETKNVVIYKKVGGVWQFFKSFTGTIDSDRTLDILWDIDIATSGDFIFKIDGENSDELKVYSVPYCGDNLINQVWETCDGTNLSGKACSSFGYTGGNLKCYPSTHLQKCTFNISGCFNVTITNPIDGSAFTLNEVVEVKAKSTIQMHKWNYTFSTTGITLTGTGGPGITFEGSTFMASPVGNCKLVVWGTNIDGGVGSDEIDCSISSEPPPEFRWENPAGGLISTANVGDTIYLVVKNSGLSSGSTANAEIWDKDLIFDDPIRTGLSALLGNVDALKTFKASWTITQADYDAAGSWPENHEQYYFKVTGVADQSGYLKINIGTTPDTTPPTFSNVAHNNTGAGQSTKFSIYWNDNIALHPKGRYIFSTNNTGTWANDSAINFTATPSWANVTKTLNSIGGLSIGYRWYATDDAGNWNSTSVYSLTTTDPTTHPTPLGPSPELLQLPFFDLIGLIAVVFILGVFYFLYKKK